MSANRLALQIAKSLPEFHLDIRHELDLTGITALFGPSGSGKTSLLHMLAGLERPDQGKITLGDTVLCDTALRQHLPVHQRRIGIVFQDARLLPHLTVQQNLEYAERRHKKTEHTYRLKDISEGLELNPLLARRPDELSGGERARVAIGLALACRPRLLLLDEPLSGLDHVRKQKILAFLKAFHLRTGLPMLYVSHDMDELINLAEHAIILKSGKIVESGPLIAALNQYGFEAETAPKSILSGTIESVEPRHYLMTVRLEAGVLKLPIHKMPQDEVSSVANSAASKTIKIGTPLHIRIAAEDVALALDPPIGLSLQNILKGQIENIQPIAASAMTDITLSTGGQNLTARITKAAFENMALHKGMEVYALIKTARFAQTEL